MCSLNLYSRLVRGSKSDFLSFIGLSVLYVGLLVQPRLPTSSANFFYAHPSTGHTHTSRIRSVWVGDSSSTHGHGTWIPLKYSFTGHFLCCFFPPSRASIVFYKFDSFHCRRSSSVSRFLKYIADRVLSAWVGYVFITVQIEFIHSTWCVRALFTLCAQCLLCVCPLCAILPRYAYELRMCCLRPDWVDMCSDYSRLPHLVSTLAYMLEIFIM